MAAKVHEFTLRVGSWKLQATSAARVKGLTPEAVASFFGISEPLMQHTNFSLHYLFNCSETGLTVVQHKVPEVISMKGKWQVSCLISKERFTCNSCHLYECKWCVCALSANISRSNMKAEVLDGAPPGSITVCHKSGWIQTEIFAVVQTFSQYHEAI